MLDVGHLRPEGAAIANRGPRLLVGVAHHNADVGDAGLDQVLQHIEQHRLIGNGHQLFRPRKREGAKTRTFSTAEHQTLHGHLYDVPWLGRRRLRRRATLGISPETTQ